MDAGVWQGILEKYGQQVTLLRGEERTEVRAFFQPVAEKAAGEVPTALGVAPAGKWLYLGPSGEELNGVTGLLWHGRRFRLLRHRGFPVGDTVAYRWAIAEEEDEVTA